MKTTKKKWKNDLKKMEDDLNKKIKKWKMTSKKNGRRTNQPKST